jgi:hypothetical protein
MRQGACLWPPVGPSEPGDERGSGAKIGPGGWQVKRKATDYPDKPYETEAGSGSDFVPSWLHEAGWR